MKNFILLCFVALLLISCDKDKNCDIPEQEIGSGEIIQDKLVSDSIIMLNMRNQNYVIQSDSANFQNVMIYKGQDIPRDSVDFSAYTVLGKYTSGDCRVSFERRVTRDNIQKKVYYRLKVHECGNCERYSESMNWVLVPKIPDDYEVLFHVE
jgi:hypothetical protein